MSPLEPSEERLYLGVSRCLLGEAVRYDGGHKRHAFLCERLLPQVDVVGVCPEVGIGLGVPRPTLRLLEGEDGLRLVTQAGAQDHTPAMRSFAESETQRLVHEGVVGFILKSRSPSCGLTGLPVFDSATAAAPLRLDGRGLFANELVCRHPELPVIDEVSLGDPRQTQHFLERAFALHALQKTMHARQSPELLGELHQMFVPFLSEVDPELAALPPRTSRELTDRAYGERLLAALETHRLGAAHRPWPPALEALMERLGMPDPR